MQEKIMNMLLEQEDVTWKTIIYDLVKSEQMDPWNINISLLTNKYITTVKKLQEHDLKISGKILLAAAILLKIKSSHLIEHGVSNLDRLINQTEDVPEDELLEEIEEEMGERKKKEEYTLITRQPQPRNRKVSVNDLVNALQRAMESKKRTLAKKRPVKYKVPKKGIDIMEVIYDLYHKLVYYSKKNGKKKTTFSQLLPKNPKRNDKVYTFIPLLHLENQQKVETEQKESFGKIDIKLTKNQKTQLPLNNKKP